MNCTSHPTSYRIAPQSAGRIAVQFFDANGAFLRFESYRDSATAHRAGSAGVKCLPAWVPCT